MLDGVKAVWNGGTFVCTTRRGASAGPAGPTSMTSSRRASARPLRRALQKYVENPLSTQILKGEIGDGDTIKVMEKDSKLEFLKI